MKIFKSVLDWLREHTRRSIIPLRSGNGPLSHLPVGGTSFTKGSHRRPLPFVLRHVHSETSSTVDLVVTIPKPKKGVESSVNVSQVRTVD